MTALICDKCKERIEVRSQSSNRSDNGCLILCKGDDIHLCDACTILFEEWLQQKVVADGN